MAPPDRAGPALLLFPLLPNLFDALARSTLGDGFYRAQLAAPSRWPTPYIAPQSAA
jgi:hypothetical protein